MEKLLSEEQLIKQGFKLSKGVVYEKGKEMYTRCGFCQRMTKLTGKFVQGRIVSKCFWCNVDNTIKFKHG